MIKKPILSLLFFVCLTCGAQTGKFSTGITIGPSISSGGVIHTSSFTGITTDIHGIYGLKPNIDFYFGLGYTKRGYAIEVSFSDQFDPVTGFSQTLISYHFNYLDIPLKIVYHGVKPFHFAASVGLTPSFLLMAKRTATTIGSKPSADLNNFNYTAFSTNGMKFNLFPALGAGIGYTKHKLDLGLMLQFEYGILTSGTATDGMRDLGLLLRADYLLK
jgi:hypothetical protein